MSFVIFKTNEKVILGESGRPGGRGSWLTHEITILTAGIKAILRRSSKELVIRQPSPRCFVYFAGEQRDSESERDRVSDLIVEFRWVSLSVCKTNTKFRLLQTSNLLRGKERLVPLRASGVLIKHTPRISNKVHNQSCPLVTCGCSALSLCLWPRYLLSLNQSPRGTRRCASAPAGKRSSVRLTCVSVPRAHSWPDLLPQ